MNDNNVRIRTKGNIDATDQLFTCRAVWMHQSQDHGRFPIGLSKTPKGCFDSIWPPLAETAPDNFSVNAGKTSPHKPTITRRRHSTFIIKLQPDTIHISFFLQRQSAVSNQFPRLESVPDLSSSSRPRARLTEVQLAPKALSSRCPPPPSRQNGSFITYCTVADVHDV